MEIQQIRYFLAVSETASFTKAAARCFVSQPTLSAGIRKLEDDLGAALFSRAGRRVALTEAGARLLGRARTIMGEVRAARTEARSDGQAAPLRLGVLPSLAAAALARLARGLSRLDSAASLTLREGNRDELNAWLAQGRLDAALTVLPPGDSPGATALPLFRARPVLLTSPDHALAHRGTVAIERLDGAPFILRSHCEFLPESRRVFDAHGVRPRLVLTTARDDLALALAAAGVGVTVAPDRLLPPGLVQARIAELDVVHDYGLRLGRGDNPHLDTLRHAAESMDWRRPRRGDGGANLDWAH